MCEKSNITKILQLHDFYMTTTLKLLCFKINCYKIKEIVLFCHNHVRRNLKWQQIQCKKKQEIQC